MKKSYLHGGSGETGMRGGDEKDKDPPVGPPRVFAPQRNGVVNRAGDGDHACLNSSNRMILFEAVCVCEVGELDAQTTESMG